MFKISITYFYLALAILLNPLSPAIAYAKLSDSLGDKIIICSGWGIEYIDISELPEGYEKSNIPQISKNHCPLCLNPSADLASKISPSFEVFLKLSLNSADKFSNFDNPQFYISGYYHYLTSNDPPKLS